MKIKKSYFNRTSIRLFDFSFNTLINNNVRREANIQLFLVYHS